MTTLRALAALLSRFSAWAETVLSPWLALAVRLWLAQAFLAVEAHEMMAGHTAAPLAQAWARTLQDIAFTPAGLAVQTLCPILLAAGLFCRPAALAMLIQAVAMTSPAMLAGAPTVWTMMLAWLLVRGPGPFALDALLRRGAQSLAIPGAAQTENALTAAANTLGPVYQLALRLWLATALAAPWLPSLWFARSVMLSPALPPMVEMLPPLFLLFLSPLLIIGLGTRRVAGLLLTLVPLGPLASGDARLDWAPLLAILVIQGPLWLSADHWLVTHLRRKRPPPDRAAFPHVVVVGGGFGGIAAVQGLRHAPCRITLVDKSNHHLFQPLLYQVATASLSPADIATPVRAMLRDQPNVHVLLAEVTGIDSTARTIQLPRGPLPYDYLILATGARHGYFGRDDWAPFAPGLKTIEDGTAIRRRLLLAFEEAENATTGSERQAWLTFVVVGGGPTGVELAGAIAELARHGMEHEFRQFDPADAQIILVQSAPRLLPAFPESLSHAAAHALHHLGVDVRLGQKVEEIGAGGVTISGAVLPARTILWAAGVMASPAGSWLGAAQDRAGRVTVAPNLSVPGAENVFAIGDTAASSGWGGQPVPGLAPAAKQGGAYVARLISAKLEARPAPKPFRYRHFGSLATIGRQSAVADFGFIRFGGAFAWWLWGAAHIAFLVGGRNRATVLIQWLWAYLTLKRGTRLITNG